MSSCGIDTDKFFGETVSFKGYVFGGSGQPPPKVDIKEDISEDEGCSLGTRSYSIQIQGEFVCCDPQQKVSLVNSMLSLQAGSCGDFSGGGLSLKAARLSSLDISSSNYIDNVPYSATILWTDPSYGNGAISNPVDSVQAVENDDSVTITHTVSASASLTPEDCQECEDCDIRPVIQFVESKISPDSQPPSPSSFSIPKNPNLKGSDCPTVSEETDSEKCFFSITKVWTIQKKINLYADEYGEDIVVTKCEEESTDENQETTITISGSVSYEASAACELSCSDNLKKVTTALNQEIENAISSRSGREHNISKSINEGSNPSASYTVTFPPNPDDSGPNCKNTFNVSVSFGTDGVGTVTVNGSAIANQSKLKTQSENCLCEAAEDCYDGGAEAKSLAMGYYDIVKSNMESTMRALQGPCYESNSLNNNPTDENVDDCEGGSKNYSFTWKDEEQCDGINNGGSWNYSVNVSRPVEIVSIQPTLGGGYCVVRSGKYTEGTVSVSGGKENCPDAKPLDADAESLALAKKFSGANNLVAQDGCEETVVGDQEENSFNKSFKWDPNNGGGGNMNFGNRNNNRRGF
jgi:hypothetical protein